MIVLIGSVSVGIGLATGASHVAPSNVRAAASISPGALSRSAPETPAAAHPSAGSPHPGTLDIYEVAAAGGTTEDPALAYDTVSAEPIENVYETLINYNGSGTNSFVPTLATCVPGTAQCVTDYGTNLTAGWNSAGVPEYWTFVIDPAAQFFDPSTGNHWSVYPSDVMFSIARTLSWTDVPYAGKTAGWLLAQALLPNGSGTWDTATHYPYNNTPANILGSMLINDSTYCPTKAMNGIDGNGCVTFIANGSGQFWPFFLDLVADNLGASIVPCGWFTAQSAGLPGWIGSSAASGDGPCLLPDGGNNTNGASWSSYLASLGPESWDSFELSNSLWPSTQPAVQWSMVGSGPYAAAVTKGVGYELEANPNYAQPSGCSGAGGLAVYTGYCDPAAESYQPHVNVFWEPNDTFGIGQYEAGQADVAAIEAVHTSTLLSLAAAGKLYYFTFPTINDFFIPVNLAFNEGVYSTEYPSQPPQTIPETAFSDLGLRNFYVDSYPYLTVENEIRTFNGIQYSFNAGGAIPYGMGNYYPDNISYPGGDPYHPNLGPDLNPADVGGVAWWWAQITSPTSPYYDATLAKCTHSTPCTWAIAGLAGDPADNTAIADWISEIETITHGALQPFGGASLSLVYCEKVVFQESCPPEVVSWVGSSWEPDYPDPTDYVTPELLPDSTYTAPPSFAQQVGLPRYDDAAVCGHSAVTLANLDYWSNAAQTPASGAFNSTCQGVAYGVAVGYLEIAGALAPSPTRVLYYNLAEQITNRLAMYVWNGQTNEVMSAAPWILESSINMNVMIGGIGDQLWFHIQYQSYKPVHLYNMTFTETGLSAGAKWNVNIGAFALNTTTSTSELYKTGNGTVYYTFTAPGYGAVKVTGPKGTTLTSTVVDGANVSLAVKFAPAENVFFNETGLSNGSAWSVFLTGINGAPNEEGTGIVNLTSTPVQNTSFEFSFPAGAHYKYQVIKPSIYKASGLKGSFGVPTHELVKAYNFVPYTAKITFTEKGLPAKTAWTVYLNGTGVSLILTSLSHAQVVNLANGTYSYSVPGEAGYSSSTPNGTISVYAPHPQTVRLTFHSGDSPGPQRLPAPASGPPELRPSTIKSGWTRKLSPKSGFVRYWPLYKGTN